jgi:hypothetical protein
MAIYIIEKLIIYNKLVIANIITIMRILIIINNNYKDIQSNKLPKCIHYNKKMTILRFLKML